MFEDVKILTSPDKDAVERFIMEYSDKWYYKNDFKTDIIYNSFQFSWAYQIYYTVIMVKYKEEPIQNSPVTITSTEDPIEYVPVTTTSTEKPVEYTWFASILDNNTEQNATEIWGEGELSTITEQIHSKKWGRSKKGKDTQEEVSTTTDSSSVHED